MEYYLLLKLQIKVGKMYFFGKKYTEHILTLQKSFLSRRSEGVKE